MHRLDRPVILPLMILCIAGIVAGDLNPPAGPVAPTMKTLEEVEARIPIDLTNTPGDADSIYKITAPGSYYLTGNIQALIFSNKHGIEIESSGVTLDLNGFDLRGGAGMSDFDGVRVTAAGLNNITILNGSVRNWGGNGIDLGTSAADNGRIEGVNASGNNGHGIEVGSGFAVVNCSASGNGGNGFDMNDSCAISRCSADGNAGHGFSMVFANSISECSSRLNGANGFVIGPACTVSRCAAYDNSSVGFQVGVGSIIESCAANSNNFGIEANSNTIVRGNNCDTNSLGGTGAGIRLIGTDALVEGNNCTDNRFGIDADFSGNVIVRNVCRGNTTNWNITAGNVILVVQATTAAGFSGDSGGVSPGSTNPSANFTY